MNWVLAGKAFAEAVSDVSKLTAQLLAGKEVARLKYRAEAAMNYVAVDERVGEYEGIDDKREKKLKLHFRKRIFDVA